MPIETIVDSVINVLKRNLVSRSNVVSDVSSGDTVINVENSFHFKADQEIVLIDYGYNVEGSPHYQIFEYSKIKSVNNTNAITVTSPIISNWMVANGSFIQKTIGHSPIYDDQIYYGDRDVIPTDNMAITVEPSSMSNEWIYLQGGLSEEYKLSIKIYGKDVKFEEGRRILDRYSDTVAQILNENIHIGVAEYSTPILANVFSGNNQIVIEDTQENREKILPSIIIYPSLLTMSQVYQLQDNQGADDTWFGITNIAFSSGQMILTIDRQASKNFLLSEFGVLKRFGAYIYDSRASSATYGVISKGSAILRASEISWYGKFVNEFRFPQKDLGLNEFQRKG
jgi:hypothetical protein